MDVRDARRREVENRKCSSITPEIKTSLIEGKGMQVWGKGLTDWSTTALRTATDYKDLVAHHVHRPVNHALTNDSLRNRASQASQ